MLSIDNTYSEEELREFDARVRKRLGDASDYDYVVDPKIDGVAVSASATRTACSSWRPRAATARPATT